jgi:hypothetical protein
VISDAQLQSASAVGGQLHSASRFAGFKQVDAATWRRLSRGMSRDSRCLAAMRASLCAVTR